jgi:peptide/nickel transport system permease protein
VAADADGDLEGVMASYLIKRIIWALITLVGVSVITFVVVYRIPADPAVTLAGPSALAHPEVVQNIRHKLKLDRPVMEQYARFVSGIARGDLGQSYATGQPVGEAILRRLPATAMLAVAGWLCWLVLGVLIGVWVSARPTRMREGALLLFSIVGVSTPTFWVGILLLYLFVSRLALLPAGGYGTPAHFVLPVATLALSGVAYYARLAHSGMTETLREAYVRTAVAKGVPPRAVLYRHALRNALLPLVTIAGADLAALLGGVVFTETVFDWPGLGRLAVDAVGQKDVPMIVGVVLVSATFVVVANVVVDLLYPLLDPRIDLR